MKVTELRTALKRLGEDTRGLKAALVGRLNSALATLGDGDGCNDGLLEELSVAE